MAFEWFNPRRIDVPACVRKTLEFVYPSVDWDRVTFHIGFPHYYAVANEINGKSAITLPNATSMGTASIYFREGKWEPCTIDGLGLIIHEGYHVLQIQSTAGGYGIGLINPSTISYISCVLKHGYEGHPAETEAYVVAGDSTSLFESCCTSAELPCDCGCFPPSVDYVKLQALKTKCSHIVQDAPATGFWEKALGCIPGLEAIGEFAAWIYTSLCPQKISKATWGVCFLGWLLAGFFWLVYIAYAAIWLTICLAIAVVLEVLSVVLEVVGWLGSVVTNFFEGLWDAVTSPFSSPSRWIWFTFFDGSSWQIPDFPVTQNDHSRTARSPAIAEYGGLLVAAYRGAESSDLYYNVFDGNGWLDPDVVITRNGRTRSNDGPALAEFNGLLYMAYRGTANNDIFYNVFDGTTWLSEDVKVSRNGRTKTLSSPALASYRGRLYMAYRGTSDNNIWYNIFDGVAWLNEDIKISRNGRTRTSGAPALAVYLNRLYLVYKGSSSSAIYYNVFDGNDWLDNDIRISQEGHTATNASPSLASYANKLFIAYKGSDSTDIWYNTMTQAGWRVEDCRVSDDSHVKTNLGPALAVFAGRLFLVYKDDS